MHVPCLRAGLSLAMDMCYSFGGVCVVSPLCVVLIAYGASLRASGESDMFVHCDCKLVSPWP
jgi:hypothetical protein